MKLDIEFLSRKNGTLFPPNSRAVAALLAGIFCLVFYNCSSSTLIGDGLRHLPALRTITRDAATSFQPRPWLDVYRDHYDALVVHNHFLFGAAMRAAFALQQKLGIPGDALIAMHAVNALSAAIGGALFFLLSLRVGVPGWISLAITLGLCCSPAYLLAATNVAEAALALPFFMGTLLLLAARPFVKRTPLVAGVLAGFAALSYLLAGSLAACIVLAVVVTATPFRLAIKPLLVFLVAFGGILGGIWVSVLLASGFRTPDRLLRAVLRFPQQGTYGGFKLSSLIATPVGLTEAFIHVLPDDFRGLRGLYHQTWTALYVGAATIIVCTFLAFVIHALFNRGIFQSLLFLSCLLTFLLVEAACMEWDAYYQKLQVFALIVCWVMVAGAFSKREGATARWFLLPFLVLVITSGLWVLRKNLQPSQPRMNAEQLSSIVGNGVLITGWSADVMHMLLFSNGDNFISLPDFALERSLDSKRVRADLEAIIQQSIAHGGSVYFYGVLDEETEGSPGIYETRFRLAGFTDYLHNLQRKAHPVATLPQPGGRSMILYSYAP